VLRRQSATRRSDERTTRRDDWTESTRHPRLVPEQTMQGQETIHAHEAAAVTAAATAAAASG